jgi:hypothetical protein
MAPAPHSKASRAQCDNPTRILTVGDLADLYLGQVADLREFAQATEAGEGTMHLEDALRQREIRRADLYRQFEQAAFSPAPIPVVAPNELDLPEDN